MHFTRTAAVAGLTAVAVLSDEVVHGRSLTSDAPSDLGIGLILCAVALGLLRRWSAQTQATSVREVQRQARAIDDVVLAVSKGGHADAVLGGLPRRACEILGVEKAIVVVQDRDDPRSSSVVAGHGVPEELLGERFGIDEGMFGEVMLSGRPVLVDDYRQFHRALAHPAAADLRCGGAVPIRSAGRVRAALAAGSTNPDRRFGEEDLETLTRLAELGSVAVQQAIMREQLEEAVDSGVEAMAAAVHMRDNYTSTHSDEVVELARRVGERLGLGEHALRELGVAARLHDVGKIGVPDAVLQKDGDLDHSDWEVMEQHPVWGAEMLGRITGLRTVAKIVRHGHERWDGDGYPDGLKREQIPLESRILLACDAYHAMISNRPYREALRPWLAVSELREGAGGQFDPEVVEVLVKTLRESAGASTRLFDAAAAPR